MAGVDQRIETITTRALLPRQQWPHVRESSWRDAGAPAFERDFIEPLERQTKEMLGALASLSRVISFAERSAK